VNAASDAAGDAAGDPGGAPPPGPGLAALRAGRSPSGRAVGRDGAQNQAGGRTAPPASLDRGPRASPRGAAPLTQNPFVHSLARTRIAFYLTRNALRPKPRAVWGPCLALFPLTGGAVRAGRLLAWGTAAQPGARPQF
jgi:hypothetical protein